MLFLLSNLWLLYLISLVLMFVVILIVDHGGIDALIAAAVLELIPILGLWCTRSGYMVPAVVIAVLCCIAGLAGGGGAHQGGFLERVPSRLPGALCT